MAVNQFCFALWWCHRASCSAVVWPFTQWPLCPDTVGVPSPSSAYAELWCCISSASDTRILHVVGVACVLGFSASFTQLPGFSSQQDAIPTAFRSRALLWTTDSSGIRVSLVLLSRRRPEGSSVSCNLFSFHHFRLLPPERSLVSPSAPCPPCSTSAPDSLRYTLM